MNLIGRLKIRHKLMLIYVMLIIPVLVLLYLLVSEKDISIKFAQKEIHGDAYLRPVYKLLDHTLRCRIAGGPRGSDLQARVDEDFKLLDEAQRRSGNELKTEDQLKALKDKWQALKDSAAPGDKAFNAFIADIRALISNVGDSSNLILDPDLDTYYMMDATLIKLPEIADLVGRSVLIDRGGRYNEQSDPVVVKALLNASLDGLTGGLGVAFKNNPAGNLRSKLEKPLAGSAAVLKDFISVVGKRGSRAKKSYVGNDEAAVRGPKALEATFALYDLSVKELDTLLQRRIAGFYFKMYAALGFVIILIGLATVFIFLVIRNITTPLRNITHTMQHFENDLTVRIPVTTQDEIGQLSLWLNAHIEGLHGMMKLFSEATRNVNRSASEISVAVQEQAAVSSEQSASVSEITSTMEELSASSSQIAEHSKSVVDIAGKTWEDTKKGATAIETVLMKMSDINNDNQHSINEILELGKKSKEITKIMEIINTIADQTKLIAFNAALEASGAGEAGKRFGVVAVEIRRLADSVMESTGEIEGKVNEIQESINRLVIASEKGSKGIQDGMESSSQTASILMDIVDAAQTTTDSAKQISLSTQQQKTASNQVVTALREIVAGTGQTTESIDRITGISKEMARLSDELKVLVERFKLEDRKA